MEEKEITLKPKKPSFLDKIKNLFKDKKKRYLYMCLFMLPFLIAIGIFGFVTYKEVKNLLTLATGSSGEIRADHRIESMGYTLRDNNTEIQLEYFTELKEAIEVNGASEKDIAGLVCKNFVADFYTWTNKQGQYDVGGLYYVYNGEDETGDYKKALYTQARDGFYQYINKYINEYGQADLLEVESVNVTNASKAKDEYPLHEFTEYVLVEEDPIEGNSYAKVFDDVEYDAYEVTCTWTYKPTVKFDTSKYPTKQNFLVVFRNGRYEIVEASENKIDVKVQEQEETDQTESGSETIED